MLPYIEAAYTNAHSAEPESKKFKDFITATRASIDRALNIRFTDPYAPREKRRFVRYYPAGLGWIDTEGFMTLTPESDLHPETIRHLGLISFVGRETQDPISKWLNDHISHALPMIIVEAKVDDLGSSKGLVSKEIFYIGSDGITVFNTTEDTIIEMNSTDELRMNFLQELPTKLK